MKFAWIQAEKAQGPRYQSRMNAVLRSFMGQRRVGIRRKTG